MSHESEKSETLPPGLGINSGDTSFLPGDSIDKELDEIEFEALQIEAFIDAAHLEYHSDVEIDIDDYIPELYADDSDSDQSGEVPIDSSPLGPEDIVEVYSYSDEHDWNTAVIGGAVISNLCLVVPDKDATSFADLPVRVIRRSAGTQAQLLAYNPSGTDQENQHELPILLMPEEDKISSSLQDWKYSDLAQFPPYGIIAGLLHAPTEGIQVNIGADTAADPIDDGTKIAKADLDNYVLSGNLNDFFGIKGLGAKLYTYKGPTGEMDKDEDKEGDKKPEPAREKVKLNPNSYEFVRQPLEILFPFLEGINIKNTPIKSLEFTYSEEEENFFSMFPPGLCLQVEVLLGGGLQWASNLLKNLFGDEKPPTSIHLCAHLSDERDWTKAPKIDKLVLKGEFRNLPEKPWHFLQFKSIGIELTVTKATSESSKAKVKEKKSWNFGFGLFGMVLITHMPHANAPLYMKYRIARDFVPGKDEDENEGNEDVGSSDDEEKDHEDGNASNHETDNKASITDASKKITQKGSRKLDKKVSKKGENDEDSKNKRLWSLVITSDKWEDIYGIKNVTMTEAKLVASFEEGDFGGTLMLKLSADLKLGEETFQVTGKISRDDNFLNAEIGDLTLSKITRIYEQISGKDIKPSPEDEDEAAGYDLTFKKLSLNLSSKKSEEDGTTMRALQLDGHVTFDGKASATAKLRIASDGLTIEGGIDDFKVPQTEVTIKKAGLSIFMGFKQTGSKAIADDENAEGDAESKSKDNLKGIRHEISKGKSKKELKKKGSKRKTKFEILGEIEIKNFTVKIGFHISRKKGKKEYDWLAFGLAKDITLSKIWPELSNTFLDLQLNNVAFIASSEARAKKRKDGDTIEMEKENEKIEEDEKKVDDDDEAEKSANWDVLAEVELLNYPIVKGMQLCTTVTRFEELKNLNSGNEIPGLVLIVSIAFDGEIAVSIDLPKSFAIDVGDYAKIGDFNAAVAVSSGGPELRLAAILTLRFEDHPPIGIKGVINAGSVGGGGKIFMTDDSKWENPFNLSKNVIVRKLGAEVDFEWATIKKGPRGFSITGKLYVGDFKAELVFHKALGITKRQLVFLLKVNKINITEIVRLAGNITDNIQLQNMKGDENLLSFNNLKLYFSTGAYVLEKHYERGIHVAGKVRLFDKSGEFEGNFTSDGIVIEGGLDNFEIGGLQVKSTRAAQGVERATMKITMSSETQKIFIDGMIQYHNLQLKILIDTHIQEKRFYANVSIEFAKNLSIELKAVAKAENQVKLAGISVEFEAELNIDLFGAIFNGIATAITTLADLATKAINEIEADIQRKVDIGQEKMHQMRIDLKRMKEESNDAVASRMREINAENTARRTAKDELDRLENEVKAAEAKYKNHSEEIKEKEIERDAARRRLDDLERAKAQEYNRQIATEKTKQLQYKKDQKALEDQKNARWGDVIRNYQTVQKHWDDGQVKIAELDALKIHYGKMWKENILARPYWGILQAKAAIDLEFLKAQVGVETGILQAANKIFNSSAFKDIEAGIQNFQKEIDKIGSALNKLVTKGVAEFVQELSKNEKAYLELQIQTVKDLYRMSKQLENALKQALDALKRNKDTLTKAEGDAQLKITRLEQDIKLKPFENEYRHKQTEYESLVAHFKLFQGTLKDVKKFIEDGVEITKQMAEEVKQVAPRITKIYVKASTATFVKSEPLIFEVVAVWNREESKYRVEWAPGTQPSELYKKVALQVMAKAQPISNPTPALPKPPKSIPENTNTPKSIVIPTPRLQSPAKATPKLTSKPIFNPMSKPTSYPKQRGNLLPEPLKTVKYPARYMESNWSTDDPSLIFIQPMPTHRGKADYGTSLLSEFAMDRTQRREANYGESLFSEFAMDGTHRGEAEYGKSRFSEFAMDGFVIETPYGYS